MSVLLVQIPVDVVSVDTNRFPDRDQGFVFEHLVRYCEKFDPLPAITIAVEQGAATIVRGHKYLEAARVLGRRAIRAVVSSPPTSEAVKGLLARPDVTRLDWEALKRQEDEDQFPLGWHVVFFARPLSSADKTVFDRELSVLFSDTALEVTHDDSGPVAEFKAKTPVSDSAWAAKSLAVLSRFSRTHVPIISLQGRRFEIR